MADRTARTPSAACLRVREGERVGGEWLTGRHGRFAACLGVREGERVGGEWLTGRHGRLRLRAWDVD